MFCSIIFGVTNFCNKNMSNLSCRYYRNKLPEIDDVVMVVVRNVAEIGAYVNLQEYNNLEGMILMSELSRRRIRSVNKLIRVGKTESVLVIRVDKDKGYIDLSKKRVSLDEVKKCEERHIKARTVYHIVLHAAEVLEKNNEEFEHLMEETVWKFDEKYKSSGGSYETFRRILNDNTILDQCDITEAEKKELITSIRHRLEPKKVKIRADIDVQCYGYEGIDAVKDALNAGILICKDSAPVKINLISPPLYMVSTVILDREEGLRLVQLVVDTIKDVIVAKKGAFALKMEPKIVTDFEEQELVKTLAEMERKMAMVDGDDDDEDVDGDGEQESDDNLGDVEVQAQPS